MEAGGARVGLAEVVASVSLALSWLPAVTGSHSWAPLAALSQERYERALQGVGAADTEGSLAETMTETTDLERTSAALNVEALTKVYADGTTALDELSLRVPAGTFFGLLGPNGAGKTTLIGATAGLVRAPAGRIFVFGHDAVADLKARLLLGVAPQEVHLDRFLSARELLAYHGRYFGMAKLEAIERADELLEVFDLSGKAKTKPNRLSGGMRRRLLIARALVHRPRLVVLDEPTAGVDLELRYELWRYLRRLHAEQGVTVLLTTHYIEEAEALCERVAFIRAGRIIVEGAPGEVVTRYGGERLEDAYLEAMRR